MKIKFYICLLLSVLFILPTLAKPDKDYITGDELKIKIKVYIWGQVRDPGEYLVEDGTDLIGLISVAGGPTDYAKLKNVKIIRNKDDKKEIITVDVKQYMESYDKTEIPVLKPGDVVMIKKSIRADWNLVIQIISQVAIIINVIYLLNRD